jgi:uncharacterized membrane protein YheB (UPF0754 family)
MKKMQRFNPRSIGDYFVLHQWCNTSFNNKETLNSWVELNSDEKTEEKLVELFPNEYEEFKNQLNDLEPNDQELAIKPSFRMARMVVGDFEEADKDLPLPEMKNHPDAPPIGPERKNKLAFEPLDQKMLIDEELQTELFHSIPGHKNMIEYMFIHYLNAEHLVPAIDNLTEYYLNSDPDEDLMTFLNRAFDYDIVKQWFAEGCLTLLINKKLPIVPKQ